MTVAMLAGCGAKEEAPAEAPAVEETVEAEAPAEETISIRKIKEDGFLEKQDEVAAEQQLQKQQSILQKRKTKRWLDLYEKTAEIFTMKEKHNYMNRAETYSLMLLAGGKSSRMGQNKAELLYKGKTFTDYSIEKAEKLGINQIYLSGNQKVTEEVQIIQDIYQEKGPLGGIHACMKAMETPYCLILPVDVPQIPVEALESMLNYHERYCRNVEGKQLPLLLKHESFMEPLIGIYPVTMADFVEKRIMEERLSVFRMIEAWGCECFEAEIQKWQAANINTRDEYEKLLKRV